MPAQPRGGLPCWPNPRLRPAREACAGDSATGGGETGEKEAVKVSCSAKVACASVACAGDSSAGGGEKEKRDTLFRCSGLGLCLSSGARAVCAGGSTTGGGKRRQREGKEASTSPAQLWDCACQVERQRMCFGWSSGHTPPDTTTAELDSWHCSQSAGYTRRH